MPSLFFQLADGPGKILGLWQPTSDACIRRADPASLEGTKLWFALCLFCVYEVRSEAHTIAHGNTHVRNADRVCLGKDLHTYITSCMHERNQILPSTHPRTYVCVEIQRTAECNEDQVLLCMSRVVGIRRQHWRLRSRIDLIIL